MTGREASCAGCGDGSARCRIHDDTTPEPLRCAHGRTAVESCTPCEQDDRDDAAFTGREQTPLDPFEPTVIAPGVAAIPLTPTPWDDLPDGQHAVTPNGTVWERRKGLWHRHPWWQGDSAEQIIEVCADPDEWAYNLGWTRKHVEENVGPLTPITLPKEPSDG